MERRSSLRRPVHHDAMIHLAGGAVWPCIIADYCKEGMLLKYSLSASSAIKASQSSSPNSSIKVEFGEDGETFSISAHPVHMMKGAAGIRFDRSFDEAVNALDDLAGSGCLLNKKSKEIEEIVHECIDAIQQYVSPLLEETYPALVAGIKDSALKASTDQIANACMAAANRIEQEKTSLHQAFLSAIQDPVGQRQEADKAISGRLSLIDKGEFEDWLTTRVVITKAETTYREHLLPLKVRMDALGLADKKHHQSPFGPALLVNGFQSALTRLHFDNSIEKISFQVFEKHVMAHLENLYIDLNAILIRHEVMPELDLKKQVKKSPDKAPEEKPKAPEPQPQSAVDEPAPAPSAPQAPPKQQTSTDSQPAIEAEAPKFAYGGPGDMAASNSAEKESVSLTAPPFADASAPQTETPKTAEGENTSSQPVIDNVSNYNNILGMVRSLNSLQGKSDEAQGSAQPTETYSDSELKAGLSALQATTANEVHALEERISLLERVLGNLSSSGEEAKAIDENQQVAIDVVDRFFGSLKGNPRLTQDAKQQLFKLEVPVLKVLLENEGFFDDHASPVRAVMNRIAQLGAKGSRLSPASKKRVESLVHQIAQEFEQDTAVFDSALEEFDKIVERQNSLYVKNVERVAAAAEGVHRVEQAKVSVAKALNQRIESGPIPQAVATLIESGWQDLLNLTHIKHGEDSNEWTRYLAVLDDLIHYAEDPAQPIQMASLIPTIQEGLKVVSGQEHAPTNVRDELKAFFESVPSGNYESVIPEKLEVPKTEQDVAQQNLRKSSELKPWILRAKSIQVGSWVQLEREGEDAHYMRLVWVAKGFSKYVFVNHQGMKVVELGLFKVATYLKDGVMSPDPYYEVPIVNQGLDDMVKDVYDKLAFEASHDKDSGLANKTEFCRQVRSTMKSGKRTAECSMLYVRFVSRHTVEEAPLPSSLVENTANIIKFVQNPNCISGRISETDFIVFAHGDDASELLINCRRECIAVCDETTNKGYFMALTGESQAHLGFNNPESMMKHALEPIEKRQKELANIAATFDEELSQEQKEENLAESNAEQQPPVLIDRIEPDTSSELSEKEFEVYCQKSMLISSDSIHEEQYELLVAEKGSATSFEPQTEEQARYLDQWWIDVLMNKQKQTDPMWDSIDYMRVKLSGYAFHDDLFKEQLILLADTGELQPNRIWFDLYFCSVIPNMHAAADMMKQLMAKGYRFCLDQFGTSQSPFPLLKVFPVDLIKIDQAFMDELNEESADESAANSIIEVAHYLGKEVLASSVDSAICLQRMKQLGVDYVQGSTISDYELLG